MITRLWQFMSLFVGMLVLFAGLTVGMTLLARRIGDDRLRRWLGGTTVTAPLKGLVAGTITPFCSWSTVPVLLGLLRSRVRTSTVAAFYLASPVLDPVLLVVLALVFGLPVAVGYGLVVSGVTVVAAMLAERAHVERFVRHPQLVGAGHGAAGWPQDAPWRGWRVEAKEAADTARGQVGRLVLPLAAASILGVLIVGGAPRDLVVRVAGEGQAAAVPAAALLGIPLYLPTEALAPLGWALRNAGVGTGPILALVVTAAGLSVPEFGLLTGIVRLPLIVGLVAIVAVTALGAGYLIPLLVAA